MGSGSVHPLLTIDFLMKSKKVNTQSSAEFCCGTCFENQKFPVCQRRQNRRHRGDVKGHSEMTNDGSGEMRNAYDGGDREGSGE